MRDKMTRKIKINIYMGSCLMSLITSLAYIFIKDVGLLVDENSHYPTICNISNGIFETNTFAMIPGYHFFIAFFAYVLQLSSLQSIRLLSLVFSITSVLIYYLIAKKISSEFSEHKTIEYYFFPILFPFFFLVYTDIFSLLVLLSAFYFALSKKYLLSGIASICSMLVRQNNIIWIAFICILIYFEKYGLKVNKSILKEYLKNIWMFVIGFVSFAIFFIINRGFAFKDSEMSPSFTLHVGNCLFFLFSFFFLFLPLNIDNFTKIVKFVKKYKFVSLIIITSVFLMYVFMFKNDHPYNNIRGYFIRNFILIYYLDSGNLFVKSISFIPIGYSILSLIVTRLHKNVYYLIYPLTIIFLSLSWLIDQRYYLVPFTLFLLFKKEVSAKLEYFTIIWFIILALSFFGATLSRRWFL